MIARITHAFRHASGRPDGRAVAARRRVTLHATVLLFLVASLVTPPPHAAGAELTPPAAQQRFSTVGEVMRLGNEGARTHVPVEITGVVTFANNEIGMFFLQDDTGGVFVDMGTRLPPSKSGSLIRLTGYTERGRYKPIVTLISQENLGVGQYPTKQLITVPELWTGQDDCNWVSVRAFVRNHTVDRELAFLKLADSTNSVKAAVDGMPAEWLSQLEFAEVELSGPCSVAVDDNRKIIGVTIWVPSTNQIRIIRTGPDVAATLPEFSIRSISDPKTTADFTRPIRVSGTVTRTSRRFGIQMQEDDAGLTVLPPDRPLPAIGKKIEVMGWPQRKEGRVEIAGAYVKALGNGKPSAAIPINIVEAHTRRWESTLVVMEGILRHRVVADGDDIWILEQDGNFFEAALLPGMEDLRNPMVLPGTTVKLTGVLLVGDPSVGKPIEPSLLLRSNADIEVVSAPPWPIQRVLSIISITLGLNVVGLVALGLIYGRLRNRTKDLNTARIALETANRDLEKRVEVRTQTLSVAHEALRESEERFRQLADHIDQIFWMSTPDNRQVLYLSAGFERICGCPAEKVYEDPGFWLELVHPDDRDRVYNIALSKRVTEEYQIEYRIVRPDKSIRWIRDRAFPVRDSSGAIYRVAGIAEDFTARRQSEEELREQHIALTNAMPGIARLDAAGVYTHVNSHYARKLGVTPEELIGTPFSNSVHPEDMLAAMRAYEQMQVTGKSEAEYRGIRKDGSVFWKQVLLVRIDPENGVPAGHHCFMRDITSRKSNELLLEGQKAVLETIASGAPSHETMATIVRFIESHALGTFATVMLATEDGTQLVLGACPTLPEKFALAVNHMAISPASGPCGTAAFSRQRVTVPDIETDERDIPYRKIAGESGLRACTSTPIFSGDGSVLGTLSMYFQTARGPTPEEVHLTHLATQLAAIAIEQERGQRAERDAQNRYRQIIESAIDPVITFNEELRVQVFNPAAERMFGCTEKEALQQSLDEFVAERQRSVLREHIDRVGRSDQTVGITVPFNGLRRDGTEFPIEGSISQTTLNGKKLFTGILRDLSEKQKSEKIRAQLESRLRQAQKMEAIGTLAGGIAHDFNNILGAVMLNIELAKGELSHEHPAQEYLAALKTSSIRARDLVRQILAFSRQQENLRTILRLERVVAETIKLIRAALPPNIVINLHLSSDGPSIIADPTQLHQALTNLCSNAADAMRERGGQLEIRQQAVTVTEQQASELPDLQPGNYVELVVSDTGAGMPPEVMERIFDPFFTTKALGEGTGLGLAVVHGIMKDHDGAIVVGSTPEKGTIFHLYFPAVDLPESSIKDTLQPIPRGKGQRVLVVDDEDALLKVNQRTLERLGYSVTAFTSPTVALEAFRQNSALFDLVITDLAMPGMSGVDLSRELRNFRPDCPVIITTGYTTTLDAQNIKSLGLAGIIFKPATPATIGEMINRVLTATAPTSQP